MGYRTMVITYDDRIDSDEALRLVADAEPGLKKWKAETYITDDYAVLRTRTGYRITKLYDIEPICKWRAPNTCKVCAQDRCDE